MSRSIKWLLITLLGIIVLLVLAIAIFIATFNPNTYKSKLEAYVLDNYSRELLINGDIDLSVFPNLALQVSDLSLSEAGSKDQFAAIQDARLSVAVRPLLSKRLEIDHIAITGLEASIIKNKNGEFNFANLMGKAAGSAAETEQDSPAGTAPTDSCQSDLLINIAGIQINNGQIKYLDKSSGLNLNIYEIQAKADSISLNKPFASSFQALINSNQPQLAMHLDMASKVTLSNNYKDILLEDLVINTSGDLVDLKQLKSTLKTNLNLQNNTISANNLQFDLSGDLAGAKPLAGIHLQLSNGQFDLQSQDSAMAGNLAFNQISYKDEIRNIQIADVATNFKSDDAAIQLNDIRANLYEGSLLGKFSLNKNNQIGLNLDLQKISLQALLKSLSAKDLLAGRGFVQLALNSTGKDIKSIEKSLTGKLALQVQEGALLGVNARQTLMDISALLNGLSNIKELRLDNVKSPFSADAQTAFSQFDLLINLKNGQGNINNLLIKSDLFDVVQGSPATINVPDQSINVLLNTKISNDLPKSAKLENILGITIPVHVKGAWNNPEYSVKLDSLLRDEVIKGAIESGIDKLLGNDKKNHR